MMILKSPSTTRNAISIQDLKKNHELFYKEIRKYHPSKKIVLMTSCCFNHRHKYDGYDEIVRTTYLNAKKRNENTYLLETRKLFLEREYGLIAVDGSHLNDIGMLRVANALIKLLRG